MSKLEPFILAITVRQDFGYPDISTCRKYPAGSTVTIQNQVGVANNSTADTEWIKRLSESGFVEEVKLLQKCNPSCTRSLLFDENGDGAFLIEVLLPGQPNPIKNHTKSLFVTMDLTRRKHKSDVVVTGDFELPGGFSVALPSHRPLMAIRDPPGGSSFAYYNNVKSTTRVTLEHYESFVESESLAKISFGADLGTDICVGLGFVVCTKLLELELNADINYGGGGEFKTALSENTNTASYTSTWSYQTSTDQWMDGKLSDVFLVPILNVVFKDVTEVLLSLSKCVFTENKLKFALDSPILQKINQLFHS